jgi:hypothetical protein
MVCADFSSKCSPLDWYIKMLMCEAIYKLINVLVLENHSETIAFNRVSEILSSYVYTPVYIVKDYFNFYRDVVIVYPKLKYVKGVEFSVFLSMKDAFVKRMKKFELENKVEFETKWNLMP